MMPFKSKRELPEEVPLTDAERKQKIKQVQEEQEERLRRAIGDDFFEWLAEYDDDLIGCNPMTGMGKFGNNGPVGFICFKHVSHLGAKTLALRLFSIQMESGP